MSTGLVTLGSHTHTHALLDRVDEATAADELERSIDLMAERAGVAAAHFAYPKALVGNAAIANRAVDASVPPPSPAPARTRTGEPTRTGSRVRRSSAATGCSTSSESSPGGMRLEDDVRRLVNRLRYIGATA